MQVYGTRQFSDRFVATDSNLQFACLCTVLIVRQAMLSMCTAMSFFCIGLVRGYSAPAVPSILTDDPDVLPSKDIASWASQ